MNSEKFSGAMNEVDSKYVDEAIQYKGKKAQKMPIWVKCGAMAACLCLMIVGGVMISRNGNPVTPNSRPGENSQPGQMDNIVINVASVSEMEEHLGFDVPILDKDVNSYFVMDTNPPMGQVYYADGSEFRIQRSSGDISGIYGGALKETKDIDGVAVGFYKSTDAITYAIWEHNGFSFSYVYTNNGNADIEMLIQQCK